MCTINKAPWIKYVLIITHFPFRQKYANVWYLSSRSGCVPPPPPPQPQSYFPVEVFCGSMSRKQQPTKHCPSISHGDSCSTIPAYSDECRAFVGVWCERHVHPCITPHADNLRDEWRGSCRWSDSGACNLSLPPDDGDEEITRPDWDCVCVRAPWCWGVMNLLFILSLRQQHLPHPISSLIHLPRKQTGHRVLMWTTALRRPPLEAEVKQSDMMESFSGLLV